MENSIVHAGTRTRIVIADDNLEVRRALRLILEREGHLEIAAEAESVEVLHALMPATNPDVLLVDLELSHLTGDVLDGLRKQCPGVRIVGLTSGAEALSIIAGHVESVVNQLGGPLALLNALRTPGAIDPPAPG